MKAVFRVRCLVAIFSASAMIGLSGCGGAESMLNGGGIAETDSPVVTPDNTSNLGGNQQSIDSYAGIQTEEAFYTGVSDFDVYTEESTDTESEATDTNVSTDGGVSAEGGSEVDSELDSENQVDSVENTEQSEGAGSDPITSLADMCPLDDTKAFPGQCGCGVPDTDTDLDGIANCLDEHSLQLFANDTLLAPGSASPDESHVPRVSATTWDGRLALGFNSVVNNGVRDIQLKASMFRPERAQRNSKGVFNVNNTFSGSKVFENRLISHTWHVSACSDPRYTENPYRSDEHGNADDSGSFETYRLGIFTPGFRTGGHHLMAGYGYVVVANPRSANASIAKASMDGPLHPLRTVSGEYLYRYEPSVTPDCRLVVWHGRVGNNPNGATGVAMYSYNSIGMAVNGWSEPRSITDMYYVHGAGASREPTISGVVFSDRYPFGKQPMRNYDGTVIPPDGYVAGPYPWVSFDGSEIFFPAAITFEGPTRSAVTAVGQRTGWTMRHLDGAINPSRSSLMPDIESGMNVIWPTNDDYPLIRGAYDSLKRGDGQALGAQGYQRLFLLPVGLTGSMWENSPTEVSSRFPLNKRRGVYGFFLSHSARYVEVDLHQAEDRNYVLYAPMNEQINYDRVTMADIHSGQYPGGTKWRKRRESVEFMKDRTPDVSGHHHVVNLYNGAEFPYEYFDAEASYQAAVDAYRADESVGLPGAAAVAGDSIHGVVGNAVFFRGGSYAGTALNGTAVNKLITSDGVTIELWLKPLADRASHHLISLGGVHVLLEADNVRVMADELQLTGGSISADSWHHIALTTGDTGTMLYINGVETQSVSHRINLVAPGEVTIGPYDIGATDDAVCLIDEVAVSTVQRTPFEIRQAALILSEVSDSSPVWQRTLPEAFAHTPVHLPVGYGSATDEQIALGEALFADTILSRNQRHSCQSCHKPELAFTDGLARAEGASQGDRNTPPVFNRLFSRIQFGDGRALSLEAQALEPISNPKELNFSVDGVVSRLRDSDYAAQFDEAFNLQGSQLNESHLAAALAAFQRTLISADSRHDINNLNEQERTGRGLFYGKARCSSCHTGPNFSDEKFHAIGFDSSKSVHQGRAEVTNRASDIGKFRTPTLREVSKTAPYFHDGSKATLADVIDFYDEGGESDSANKSFAMQPLGLTAYQKAALEAFLRSLDGTTLPVE